MELRPAEHVSVDVHAVSGGRRGRFRVARDGAEREIRSCVDIEGGPQLEQTVRMRQQWPSLALASALTRVGHDEIYEEALAGARELRQAEGGR